MVLSKLSVPMAVLLAVFLSCPLAAARAATPQFDPTCWTEKQCDDLETKSTNKEFVTEWKGSARCGEGWGNCFPKRPIDIAIHLTGPNGGDVASVQDVGEYIRLAYVYLIRIGALLAVLVIMIGGVMWLTSAESQRLGKAKEYIFNAILGLVLLLTSYTLLRTINPDLVALHLPGTMIIRPVAFGGEFCDQVAKSITDSGQPATFATQQNGESGSNPYPYSYDPRRPAFKCGNVLYPDPRYTSSKSCIAMGCGDKQVCVPTGETPPYKCVDGIYGGQVEYSDNAYLDDARLVIACRDTSLVDVGSANIAASGGDRAVQSFAFPFNVTEQLSKVADACGGLANQVGLLMKVEVNDEERKVSCLGLSCGVDDWFLVGPSSCNGSSQPLTSTDAEGKKTTDPDEFTVWSADPGAYWRVNDIFPLAGTTRAGQYTPCKLKITRDAFPAR